MKKSLLLILLSIYSFTTIHAEITWTLSADGTLTISGTDMPDGSQPWNSASSSIKKVIINDGVTNIGEGAFSGWYPNLTSVTIPNSVTSIGGGAFYGCSSLTSLTIPNSVTSIGDMAFSVCRALTSITIPNSVTSIGVMAFWQCSGLTSVSIPNSVTSIGGGAFWQCSGLTSITIPNSVTSIENQTFSGCSGLTSVTIPETLTSIGEDAFSGCSGLTSITIPETLTSIGDGAFGGCSGFQSIVVENGNKKYDSRNNCNAIIETETNSLIAGCNNTLIPVNVTSIGKSAFSGCSGIALINIPETVTNIGEGAFSGCRNLSSINIPETVTKIGAYAFQGCSALASINIPNSAIEIGQSAFDKTAWFDNQPDGLIYIGTFLYKYKGVMPENTNIVVKEGTTDIIGDAFNSCSGLTSITLPESVTSIGSGAFKQTGLTSITLPNSLTSIEVLAFSGCSSLTSVTIPNSVTSIGHYAFSDCKSLTSVTNLATNPQKITEVVFHNIGGTLPVLHVLPGYKAAYEAADFWKDFSIVEDATTGIDAVKETPTISSDKIFSISGQQLNKTKKGVNIINGKKILVR